MAIQIIELRVSALPTPTYSTPLLYVRVAPSLSNLYSSALLLALISPTRF